MNLSELKASAELAKTGKQELEFWREDIDPDDVLRLLEVAWEIHNLKKYGQFDGFEDNHVVMLALNRVMRGIEP